MLKYAKRQIQFQSFVWHLGFRFLGHLKIFRICYLNMCIAYTSRHYRMLDWFKSVFTIFSYLHILKLLYLYVNVLKQKHDLQLFLSITGQNLKILISIYIVELKFSIHIQFKTPPNYIKVALFSQLQQNQSNFRSGFQRHIMLHCIYLSTSFTMLSSYKVVL